MAAEGKGPSRFAIEVLEDGVDAASFRLAIGASGGTTYAVYLVDTTDPDASSVRLRTNDGTKAIRLLT